MSDRQIVWSYGGGVQSAAIGVLIKRGKLPRPDYAVMADTSREGTATWEYLFNVMKPYLLQHVGLNIEIAPHSLATVDLYAHNGDLLPPVYTTSGKLETYCSCKWKERVVMRWLRQHGVKRCNTWIGFSYDEVKRANPSPCKWYQRAFPLIDLGLTRADCHLIIESEGLPTPSKSSCWCCPHRNNQEWRFLRDRYPEDWQNAIDLERQIRERDNAVWLHRDRKPLAECDIDSDTRLDVGQCGLGYCFL